MTSEFKYIRLKNEFRKIVQNNMLDLILDRDKNRFETE